MNPYVRAPSLQAPLMSFLTQSLWPGRPVVTALVGMSIAFGANATPDAGEVVLVAGPAYVEQQGARQPVTRGYRLAPGQTIVTGEGAFVHVRMADGGMVAVRPLSTFLIEVFDYQRDASVDRVRYRLEEGVARSITGAVGESNKEAFRLNTPVAAVGVRGTDFVVATNAATSRVAVNSGAVVVAALGGQCAAEAFGSCATGGLLLGAGQQADGRYVEVVRGEQVPRLVEDPSNSPDRIQPPHEQEPLAAARLPADSQGERLRRDNDKDVADTITAGLVPPPPSVEVTPTLPALPPELPGPLVNPPADVFWGRWSNPAALEASSARLVTELSADGKDILIVNGAYGAGVDNMARQLPRSGGVSFAAAGGEGLFISGASATVLSVNAGQLDVNFDTRSFATTNTFAGDGREFHTSAQGIINDRGYLHSTPGQSDSRVMGALGEGLNSAVTTVERDYADGDLRGVVAWERR